MPDYPYVYGTGAARPVQPGGTRIRVFRRPAEGREEDQEDTGRSGAEGGPEVETTWLALLRRAVDELNASFQGSGVPFTCSLEQDGDGCWLHVRKEDEPGTGPSLEEEILRPAEFPQWLARIRSRLGLLVDEKV